MKVAGYLNLAADFTHNFTDGLAIGKFFIFFKNQSLLEPCFFLKGYLNIVICFRRRFVSCWQNSWDDYNVHHSAARSSS